MNIEGQGHFLTLAQSYWNIKNKIGFTQKLLGNFEPYFVCKLSGTNNEKHIYMDSGHMTKMAARPI